MTAQERLTAFRQALTAASEQFGVRLAIVQQLGDIVLDEPTLAYILGPEEQKERVADDHSTRNAVDPLPGDMLPLAACGEWVGG